MIKQLQCHYPGLTGTSYTAGNGDHITFASAFHKEPIVVITDMCKSQKISKIKLDFSFKSYGTKIVSGNLWIRTMNKLDFRDQSHEMSQV